MCLYHLHCTSITIACFPVWSCIVSSNIQVATSELLHILTKFSANIIPLRPSEIHTILFPRIGNTTLADTQILKAGPTPAALLKGSKLGSYRKHNNHSYKFVTHVRCTYTHPQLVMCVVCHWEYPCNSMTYHTPRRCMVTLCSICIDLRFLVCVSSNVRLGVTELYLQIL